MTTSPDKFDEMATNLYVTWVADRDCDDCTYVTAAERTVLLRAIAALVRRAVEEARAEEREAWKQTRANFLDAKQALRDERDATRALLVHATDALEAFDATKANELRAAAIRARGSKEKSDAT